MADFNTAFTKTMKLEGGYVDNPDDKGRETYKGISRRYNPNWIGWQTVDRNRKDILFPSILDKDESLQIDVRSFYRDNYWDQLLLDEVESQDIADTLFDIAVNMGTHRAGLFLQKGLNALNRNQKNYPDLIEDGLIGSRTLNCLETYLSQSAEKYLLIAINGLRICHHLNYMNRSPNQERFAYGWFNRITFKESVLEK